MSRTKLVLLALAGGLVAFMTLLGLAGFSTVSGPYAALGVLAVAIGFSEGVGLMYLLYLLGGGAIPTVAFRSQAPDLVCSWQPCWGSSRSHTLS